MTSFEIEEFLTLLEKLYNAYEQYRLIQEQEHAQLNRRCSIAEWNLLVRQKQLALQAVRPLVQENARLKNGWLSLGEDRLRPEFLKVREKLAQIQALLTRILTCDRMNETL